MKRPELRGPKWVDGEGKETDKGVVGEVVKLAVECNGDMEEGAGVMFRVYAAGADPKRDRPEYEKGAENRGGKAEAEWKPKETRKSGDTSKLEYFFTAGASRTKTAEAGVIAVKHPQILEMKWDPGILFQREEAKLTISSFELSPFAPQVKIQLWEDAKKNPEKFIFEKEITLETDNQEVSFEASYIINELSAYKGEREYQLYPRIVCETVPITAVGTNPLIVGVDSEQE